MTNEEALVLITYVGEKWGPAAQVPTDPRLLEVRIQVWMDALGDLPAQQVRAVLAAATEEFPPNVTVLRTRVLAAAGGDRFPAWDEFWAWVRTEAHRCSLYLLDSRPTLRCPWPAFEGVLTVSQLEQWARDGLAEGDMEKILQAHFRKTFEARVGREQEALARTAPAALPLVGRHIDELEAKP